MRSASRCRMFVSVRSMLPDRAAPPDAQPAVFGRAAELTLSVGRVLPAPAAG